MYIYTHNMHGYILCVYMYINTHILNIHMYVCIHILHICIYVIEMYTFRYVHRQTYMSLYQVVSRLFSGTEHCLQQQCSVPEKSLLTT